MVPVIALPRLLFGRGTLARFPAELTLLGAANPLLISDRGLERAGLLKGVDRIGPCFLDVPGSPAADTVDAAANAFREGRCDAIVAIGGGAVLDTAKMVSALVAGELMSADDLIGRPDLVTAVVPVVAIPTTAGTGSESSPVAAIHRRGGGTGVGTRHPLLIPALAICDADLTDTLPPAILAATAIDALSHCIEGFFAEPDNPLADALALDGAARVFRDVHAALQPSGSAARSSLMAAAFAGGAAIHKGLGIAHAMALACDDQGVHHGTLIAIALPHTTRLLERHAPARAMRLRSALAIAPDLGLGDAIAHLIAGLALPDNLAAAGYRIDDADRLAADMARSHFNRTSPYAPGHEEYRALLLAMAGR